MAHKFQDWSSDIIVTQCLIWTVIFLIVLNYDAIIWHINILTYNAICYHL